MRTNVSLRSRDYELEWIWLPIHAFAKIGPVPDMASSFLRLRIVGRSKAFELTELGGKISANYGLKLGIANRVFAEEDSRRIPSDSGGFCEVSRQRLVL